MLEALCGDFSLNDLRITVTEHANHRHELGGVAAHHSLLYTSLARGAQTLQRIHLGERGGERLLQVVGDIYSLGVRKWA